jgi:hypothetical protein
VSLWLLSSCSCLGLFCLSIALLVLLTSATVPLFHVCCCAWFDLVLDRNFLITNPLYTWSLVLLRTGLNLNCTTLDLNSYLPLLLVFALIGSVLSSYSLAIFLIPAILWFPWSCLSVLVYIILGYGPCTDCALSIYCSFAGWLCLCGLCVVWLCFLAPGTLVPVGTSEVGESCYCCCLAVIVGCLVI